MKANELRKVILKHFVKGCGDYKGLHAAIRKHEAIFRAYGITTFLNEINFDEEETMFLVEKCLEEMMGTDEDIHYGYNDPLQGEDGEDSGKYYLFVDFGLGDRGWWKDK